MKLDSEVVSPRNFRLSGYTLPNKDVLVEKTTNLITIAILVNYDLNIKQLYRDRYKKEDCQFHIHIEKDKVFHNIKFFIYNNEIKKMHYMGTTKEDWENHFDDFSALIVPHNNIQPTPSFYLEVYESEHMIQLVELICKYI